VFVKISEPVKLDGHWVNHPKYGRQFEAEFMGMTWNWIRMGWRTSSPTIRT